MHIDEVKKNTLAGLTQKLQDLPMLPAVVAKLMALSPNDEDFFEKVLALSRDDPPFTVRLIQVANSASFAPTDAITSLPQAVVRIGARKIVELTLSMAVLRVFVPSTDGQRNLWVHAIQVAITCRKIAELFPSLEVEPEQAYLCGLLHDIGRFVLFDESVEELGRIDESNWSTPQQLIDAEMELCGFNHAELGWHACQKWGLPKIVELCVKQHHKYTLQASSAKAVKFVNLVRVVQIADFFSVMLMLEAGFLSMPASQRAQLITQRCFPFKMQESDDISRQLGNQAVTIFEENQAITASLGLS